MKIQIDNLVRDMTPEEETSFIEAQKNIDADEEDFENALNEMGVEFNEEN